MLMVACEVDLTKLLYFFAEEKTCGQGGDGDLQP